MKRRNLFAILIAILIILLLADLCYHIVYYNRFRKSVREMTDYEKEKVIEILNREINLSGHEVNIGNIYSQKGKEIAKIELVKNNSRTRFLVDIGKEEILRR